MLTICIVVSDVRRQFADGFRIVGLTPVGRTTVRVLDLNAHARLRVRLAIPGATRLVDGRGLDP